MSELSLTTFPGLWSGDLQQQEGLPAWVWHGYVGSGRVTMLTSQWKSGKTTLLAMLLNRMGQADGSQLAGLAVRPGQAAVISEESLAHWQYRQQRLSLGNNVFLLCQPFAGLPSQDDWSYLVDHLLEKHRHHGLALVVVDSLAAFLPSGAENLAAGMLQALTPLQRLTAAGLAVMLLHHPRKGEVRAGQAARGSGALSGFVDVILEMRWFRQPDPEDRRRYLQAFSRFEETPSCLALELNADGTDYLVLDDRPALSPWLPDLLAILTAAGGPLSRAEILSHWPATQPTPSRATLCRALEQACASGRLTQEGTGHRQDPYRYRLGETEG